MRLGSLFLLTMLALDAHAASKGHSVTLGKPTPVKLTAGAAEDRTLDITVRPLYGDGKIKDFTTGNTHEVTDHEFVVRRAYRINDSLPEELRKTPKWLWQRGGWLLVNSASGRVGDNKHGDEPESQCSAPQWQRQPARVTFLPKVGDKFTVNVSGRFADAAAVERDSDEP